jgi:hypothetical protein
LLGLPCYYPARLLPGILKEFHIVKIKCLTTFLDGTRRFEVGDEVTVDAADGTRFVVAGWAKTEGDTANAAQADAAPVTLDLANSSFVVTSPAVGG